ncbi:xanthine dehydrogenase accessory protein XdhC [Pseudooceanicola aestuarii]|uniref:xanthine dehydrogenase accessory protein XdhC n=1 Tax=Pseudooceanicola aestuarii TaxID=2697319 RepID=UPI0013D25521|nr:xanthine dehydrogenase accessory protein XdhC [Pseudooceanicola aestuarii]
MRDLPALRQAVARSGRALRVVVAEVRGSTPREVGAAMIVTAQEVSGTIGGGTLEFEAIARARRLLADCAPDTAQGSTLPRHLQRRALGPDLGQCCGGAVALFHEGWDAAGLAALDASAMQILARPVAVAPDGTPDRGPDAAPPFSVRRLLARARATGALPPAQLLDGWLIEPLTPPAQPLWIWGAGHVGRALVQVLAPLPGLAIHWADTGPERFPSTLPDGVTPLSATDLPRLSAHAPPEAGHLVLTYSHAIDLALCDALLRRGFSTLGLIGSATKKARFHKRLRQMGHADAAISRIACPIGDPACGKHPQEIAVSVAAGLLRDRNSRTARQDAAREGTG